MITIFWIIAAPFILIFALYLTAMGGILLLGGIAWVLQRTWKVILASAILGIIYASALYLYQTPHTPLEKASAGVGFLVLILMFIDKFMGFPDLRFNKKPKPGTDLDTMEARVLRTIRARYPLFCLNSTYGDLENQPAFAGNRYAQIVHQAYTDLHGDCQESALEIVTLNRSLSVINLILEGETQRVQPIVRKYQEAAGEKAVEVVDIRK